MSHTFKPRYVPSDVIARWPAMAMSLWKKSFGKQAAILLVMALLMKAASGWSAVFGFLLAPSLFIICFTMAEITDEYANFSWTALMEKVGQGALRMGYMALRVATLVGIVAYALSFLVTTLLPPPADAIQQQIQQTGDLTGLAARTSEILLATPNPLIEFAEFCASWTAGVMTLLFLGLFIIVIYQGIFGAILHARLGMNIQLSRQYGWQAWQVNAQSLEDAVRQTSPRTLSIVALVALMIVCAFHSVYFSPVSLIVGTYLPCLVYVAFRSIFFGKHENAAATEQRQAELNPLLTPARIRIR